MAGGTGEWDDFQIPGVGGYAGDVIDDARHGGDLQIDVPVHQRKSPLTGKVKFAYICSGLLFNVLSAFIVWFDARDRNDDYARCALKMALIGTCVNTVVLAMLGIFLFLELGFS